MEDRNKLWITELSCSLNKWLEQDQTTLSSQVSSAAILNTNTQKIDLLLNIVDKFQNQ